MPETDAQLEMLCNRVRKNQRHLRKWAKREGVSCYRLYDKDIPEVPLAVDWYDGRLHVAEYRGKRELESDWAPTLAAGLGRNLEVPEEWVYVKTRERQRGTSQYQRVGDERARFEVMEGGHRFFVNLSDYLDTGLFLDHRITRKRFEAEADGRDVLNLFCYTGAFTVYAAKGGARSSTSVDMSKTYTAWARDNLRLNGVPEKSHRVLQEDVLAFVAKKGEPRFDLAIVDPPTFSNSKRMDGSFEVQRDHVKLLKNTLALMRPGGVLYFSNNYRSFKLDQVDLCGLEIRDISKETIPPDFRNQRIHKCYRIEV